MGKTLIHEHVLGGMPGWYLDNRKPAYQRDEALDRVADAFHEIKSYGVDTIVDPCPMDLGRDVELCAAVADRCRINIICATGVYYEEAGIPWTFKQMPAEEIAEIYIKEITEGIGRTGIKAGVIKIATGDHVVTDYERKVLTAAGIAARETGMPIISHTENCSCGHDQIDIITGQGVRPECMIVGHSDGRDDPDYQESLVSRGVFIGFDRFGAEHKNSDEVRIKNLVNLYKKGYRDQLMMSHDSVHCMLGRSNPYELRDIMPTRRMTHLFDNIAPRLEEEGLGKQDFDSILTANPRRYFEA